MNQKRVLILTLIAIVTTGLIFWLGSSDEKDSQSDVDVIADGTEVVMYKNFGCQCCDKWADYLQRHGFNVTAEESMNLNGFKNEKKVPGNMRSCHTALVDGYVVEGHVPVEDINRLLSESPQVIGITAPGMPASSPGMNTDLNEPYSVYRFDAEGNTALFASH